MRGKAVTRKELEFLDETSTKANMSSGIFGKLYLHKFHPNAPIDEAVDLVARGERIWKRKDDYLETLAKLREADRTVMIPARITKKGEPRPDLGIADDEIILLKQIHNDQQLIITMLREQEKRDATRMDLLRKFMQNQQQIQSPAGQTGQDAPESASGSGM